MEPNTESSTQPIVQPAQTVFEVKPSGAWARFWASTIDSMALSVPTMLIGIVWSVFAGTGFSIKSLENNALVALFCVLCYFAYYIYLTASRGTTVGKDAYGLKVVKYGTDEKLTYGRSAIRELMKVGILIIPVLGSLFYIINGFVIIFSKQKRGIHDRVANSQVLKFKNAWKMRKQLLYFGSYILLVIIFAFFTFRAEFSHPKYSQVQTVPFNMNNGGATVVTF